MKNTKTNKKKEVIKTNQTTTVNTASLDVTRMFGDKSFIDVFSEYVAGKVREIVEA